VVGWIPDDTVFAVNHMTIKRSVVSYIVETKGMPADLPLPALADRIKMHRTFMEAMIEYASTNKDRIISTVSNLRAD